MKFTLDETSEVSMGSMVMGVGSAPPQASFEGVLFWSISERFEIRFGKVRKDMVQFSLQHSPGTKWEYQRVV